MEPEATLESATTCYQGHLMHPESIFSPKRLPRYFRSDGWAVKLLLVMAGGSLGALSRHCVSLLAASLFGTRFPWGTLMVNLSGCFLIGLCFALAERGFRLMSPSARLFFMTGFLGSLTTFSTFALESVNAMRAQACLIMAANLLLNNVLGVALVFLGMRVGRLR